MQNLNSSLVAAAAAGAAAWHVVRPIAQPYIDGALSALPAYLAGRARDQFAAAVQGGKVPAPAVRLFKALAAAAVQWAQAEVGDKTSDAAEAAAIVDALAHVPYLDKLVAADPDDAAHDVAVALTAFKAQLAKDAGQETPAA
jgi:hypothetical protein